MQKLLIREQSISNPPLLFIPSVGEYVPLSLESFALGWYALTIDDSSAPERHKLIFQ